MIDDELTTQLRAALSRPRSVVTADEVFSRVARPDTGTTGGTPGHLPPLAKPQRSRQLAWAWLGVVVVLVVVLIVGVRMASTTPKSTVIAPASSGSVPSSWKKVTFGPLSLYAPGSWPVVSQKAWGDCGTAGQPMFSDSSVVLDSGSSELFYHCPAITLKSSIAPVLGLVVDPGLYGPLSGGGDFGTCMSVNDLTVCPTATDYGGILVLAVRVPGQSRPVAVEIGLAGHGVLAHTILYSMRPSWWKETSPPRTSKTTNPDPGEWLERTVLRTGLGQDISPTSDGLYWLDVPGQNTATPEPVTPARYDPTSGRVTTGRSVTGRVGSPAITVTDGWVWVVVGAGKNVVVEQLNPLTLSLHSTQTLPVGATLYPGVLPVLTATVAGPLWIAGSEDLWELNPSTGAVVTEIDTGNQIDSMSTDPTGNLLFTGGEGLRSQPVVTEYSAQTGRELGRTYPTGIAVDYVAATYGGVWVSVRTGMKGDAFELSASNIDRMAPCDDCSPSVYDQTMGVRVNVSEGTLWLTSMSSDTGLTCADPANGTVLASDPISGGNLDPIASGSLLYAFEGTDLVAITPPSKCFG
jgi:hypothetical protein